jgi:hypothetical protein
MVPVIQGNHNGGGQADRRSFPYVVAQRKNRPVQAYDSRAVLEPAHFFAHRTMRHRHDLGPAMIEIERRQNAACWRRAPATGTSVIACPVAASVVLNRALVLAEVSRCA